MIQERDCSIIENNGFVLSLPVWVSLHLAVCVKLAFILVCLISIVKFLGYTDF